jgi:hypothetical protein
MEEERTRTFRIPGVEKEHHCIYPFGMVEVLKDQSVQCQESRYIIWRNYDLSLGCRVPT